MTFVICQTNRLGGCAVLVSSGAASVCDLVSMSGAHCVRPRPRPYPTTTFNQLPRVHPLQSDQGKYWSLVLERDSVLLFNSTYFTSRLIKNSFDIRDFLKASFLLFQVTFHSSNERTHDYFIIFMNNPNYNY